MFKRGRARPATARAQGTFAQADLRWALESAAALNCAHSSAKFWCENSLARAADRRAIRVACMQEVLFSGPILVNVQAGNPNASFDQVAMACRMAGVHDVIEALSQGYQTEIGEHGVGLSGGQKQRLAIARALLKQPRILIFDEATSALDTETAEAFAKTINQLQGKVTRLFITHVLPRGLLVDSVLRIKNAGTYAFDVLRQGRPRI